MRKFWLLAIIAASFVAGPAAAQDADENSEAVESDDVVVEGRPRDRAMAAFQRGDFETAAVEFHENYQCVVRQRQRMLDVGTRVQTTLDERGQSGAVETVTDGAQTVIEEQDAEELVVGRICEEADWQLYMMGMSQLELGRFAEAKDAFYRVIRMSSDKFLYDAHFRIGLLELLDGNVNLADERLERLREIQRICRWRANNCGRGEADVNDDLDTEVAYLERAIASRRQARR
jgi:tetratricopeptide (TPR) repeat protein